MSDESAAISVVTTTTVESPDGGIVPASVVETPSEMMIASELGQAEQRPALEYEQAPGAGKVGSLKSRAIRSSVFTLGGFGAFQLIRFGRMLVLTRFLSPDVFALTMITGLVGGLFVQFSDVGLGPAIIQNPRGDEKKFLNTAWTLSVIRGFILFLCTALVAWPVARFYHQPILVPVLLVAGFNPLLNGFNSTAIFSLNRHLRLGRLTMLSTGTEVLQTVLIIALAAKFHNVWAIICGGIICSVVQLAASHLLIPKYRNRFAWDPAASRELFRFGKWIVVSTALTYFANETDRIMIGKLALRPGLLGGSVGALAVTGLYTLATSLVRMPWEIISRLSGSTLFPAFAQSAAGPRDEFAKLVRKARRVILPLGITAVTGLALGAPLFVSTFLDIRYLPVGWMAQLMSIGLWITILQTSADRALLALGDAHVLATTNFANVVVTFIGALSGFYIGFHMHSSFGGRYAVRGLILGVAAGNLGGHMVVQAALAKRQIWIYGQDFAYTLLAIAITFVGLVIPKLVVPREHLHHAKLLDLAWGLAVISAVGMWAAHRGWKWVRK